MLSATLKSLLAHKVRLILTVLAVVLGVGLMAGTFVLTDTIKGNIDNLFTQGVAGKAAVVEGIAPFSDANAQGGQDQSNVRPLVPESLLPAIRAIPGVAAADGAVQGTVSVVGPDGKSVNTSRGFPTLGVAWLPDHALSALVIHTGQPPTRAGEVAIDQKSANGAHLRLGSTLTVTGNLGPQSYQVVGIMGFGTQDTIAGLSLVAFDTRTAQNVVGRAGTFTEIDVAATPGTDTHRLVAAIGAALPPHYEAISATENAAQMAATIESFLGAVNTFLLAFAIIALFVGAFLIFNTFNILIGQRTRELALLRAVGAGRGQVIGSVLTEALLTGLFGSALGLGFGIGLAYLLTYLGKSSFGLGTTGLQILPRTILVSVGAGTLITLASAVLPAVRASRVPPVAAMRDDPMIPETSMRRQALIGVLVTLVGAAILALGLASNGSIAAVGGGALVAVVGLAMLVPLIASPMAKGIGAPLPLVEGVTGTLARQNSARNPRRTAATASALMIGVAVVGVIATLASSAISSFTAIFDRSFQASYVVSSTTGQPFPAAPTEAAIRQVPGIQTLSGFSRLTWHHNGVAADVGGIDPVQGPEVFRIEMVSGQVGALGQGQLLVDDTTASKDHLVVGSVVPMTFAVSGTKQFTVGGIYRANQLLGSYTLGNDVLLANANTLSDEVILVKTAQTTVSEQQAISAALHSFPDLKIQTGTEYKLAGEKQAKSFLNFVYILLGLTIVIALFGVVNTLALSVLERTREIGLLRAIGMYRRQVRGMILGEAVVVAVLGAILGLILGVGVGVALVKAVAGSGSSFITVLTIPVTTIIVVLVVAALAGLLAGLFPAQRAARLDVLKAVSTV